MPEWMKAGNTAVITGGASGLGLESARRFVAAGMNVAIADRDDDTRSKAGEELADQAGDAGRICVADCDVSDMASVETFRDTVLDRFGAPHCLMNLAGIIRRSGAPWEDLEALKTIMNVNLMGVVHSCHAFIPAMLEAGYAGAVINAGSKQGITRPPGSYVYNLSKAGVLAYTESVSHGFVTTEGCSLTAHLLVPGFVYTPMISKHIPQKPPFAWTAEQTIDFMLPCLDRGDFYVICPDEEATREVDEKRIRWNVEDIIQNRPALSRWHPDHKADFEAYMKE
jgi:NAD(P)-dependent dehydrogenase (short-subunit alcohol dehydrogenase family)